MSLKAIAKQLGISVTTVSRALNGYDDVSQETRARVEAEAQRRGYRPNTYRPPSENGHHRCRWSRLPCPPRAAQQ
ncbi:TPA: LacI family DNA-binding transcriptional regulator [Klebsiella pneumoniae]|nr:LacI family DNA-binding transcriptional regulator [Klebsiella pneumoniae]